jgi:hypothetical protein
MPSIPNKILPGKDFLSLAVALLAFSFLNSIAAEEPGRLYIIPDSGLIMLDSDTLRIDKPSALEVAPGEHLLGFFPVHTAGLWANRYLKYPFSLGSAGTKTIDLNIRDIFNIRSDPQSAELIYRGRFVGRTPGEYLFLLGTGDSVIVTLEGYQIKVIKLDDVYDSGTDLFVNLEPENPNLQTEDLQTYQPGFPFKKLLSADLLLCLGTGTTLLAGGVHFNRVADFHYQKYLRLLGTNAREKAFSQARRNDRLSKATFIAGDVSLGLFGFLIIRRFIFSPENPDTPQRKHRRLSLKLEPGKSGLTLSF